MLYSARTIPSITLINSLTHITTNKLLKQRSLHAVTYDMSALQRIRSTTQPEPRFIVTHAGDTFLLVAALTNGDYAVRSAAGKQFHISAAAIQAVRY